MKWTPFYNVILHTKLVHHNEHGTTTSPWDLKNEFDKLTSVTSPRLSFEKGFYSLLPELYRRSTFQIGTNEVVAAKVFIAENLRTN